MSEHEELVAGFVLELRRGTALLAVLSMLRTPMYGYALVEALAQRGVNVEANTLYPLLRRLEKQGLLDSAWETGGAKPRKYYTLTAAGGEILRMLAGHWKGIVAGVDAVIEGGMEHD